MMKPKTPTEILKRIHEGDAKVKPQSHISFDPTLYINTQTEIEFIDAEHGVFRAVPMDILRGKKQHPKRLKIHRGLTSQEVQLEVIRIHPYMRLDESTFKGLSFPARFIDDKFGEYWAEPQHVIKHHKSKHPKRDAFIRALDPREVQRRITEGYQDIPPRNFIQLVADTYESMDKKARFIDSVHGAWEALPNNIMKGQGHPRRKGNFYTLTDLKNFLKKHPYLTVDEASYQGMGISCRFFDKEYGEFMAMPQNLVRNKSFHPQRKHLKKITPYEKANQNLQQRYPHLTIDPLTYRGTGSKCKIIDAEYGEWIQTPTTVMQGHGHPARAVTLRGLEDKVSEILGIPRYGRTPEWLLPERSKIKPDFKLSENLYLEADGIYWHSELRIEDKASHFKRRELFEKYGKRLFQFREDEILQKPNVVRSIVENALNQTKIKYFARKAKITSEFNSRDFFEQNHLMGYAPSKSLGLVIDGVVVAALSFKVIKDEFHIIRFCTLTFSSVIGGFSKLLKQALKNANFSQGKIVNYVDLRYGTGTHLPTKGFVLEGVSLGWSWTDGVLTFNRLRCRANMDTRRLSQAEHAAELGWYKIYDAGQARFTKEV